MDISSVFKTTVQSVIIYNKNVKNIEPNIAFSSHRKQNSFISRAQFIANQIAELYQVIQDNRGAFSNLSNLLPNQNHVSDVNREKIELFAQTIIHKCLELTQELKERISSSEFSLQNQEHGKIVIFIIEEYLKHVCQVYSKQKAIKIKRTVELRRVFELKSSKTNKTVINHAIRDSVDVKNSYNAEGLNSLKIQEINGDINQLSTAPDSEQLNPKDIQIFEAENERLFNELNTLAEEIKQIENKVAHISELQGIFSEKILDQDKNLERVLTTVVGSTENVKEANEKIRNAIQRNAGFRVWILFFLLVLSFSLMFLDWYNP